MNAHGCTRTGMWEVCLLEGTQRQPSMALGLGILPRTPFEETNLPHARPRKLKRPHAVTCTPVLNVVCAAVSTAESGKRDRAMCLPWCVADKFDVNDISAHPAQRSGNAFACGVALRGGNSLGRAYEAGCRVRAPWMADLRPDRESSRPEALPGVYLDSAAMRR